MSPIHHIAGPAVKPTAHSSSGDVGKLYLVISTTADVNGHIIFKFPSVPPGTIQIGSFNCPSAPYTAQFTLTNNGPEIASWQSSNNPGSTRADPGDQLTITGTGLIASTDYAMNYSGYQTTGGVAPQVVPESHTDVVISTNQGGVLIAEAGGYSFSGSSYQCLPDAPAGFTYRIHSATVYLQNDSTANSLIYIVSVDSVGSEVPFFADSVATGLPYAKTILFNGLLVDGPVALWITPSQTGGINLHYDLIQI